jgi:hypothetical protein
MNSVLGTVHMFRSESQLQGYLSQFQGRKLWLSAPPNSYTCQTAGSLAQKQANDAVPKNSDVPGGRDCRRLRNGSDARTERQSADLSRLRLRQSPFGCNIHTRALARQKDKTIIIADDDDHRLEKNPRLDKALAAAEAVAGVAISPRTAREGIH